MISKYTYKKLVWIDVQKPTKEEIERMRDDFKIPESVCEELLVESARGKVESYDHLMFVIMHFPTKNPNVDQTIDQEIDFVIGQNFIITVHYEPIDALVTFSKEFNVGSRLERGKDIPHAGYLFHFILNNIYTGISSSIYDIHNWLKELEKNIFNGREEKMVIPLSQVNRVIIDYTQSLRFHRETLLAFQSIAKNFFGGDFNQDLLRLQVKYNKVDHLLTSQKELFTDLRETNNSLLDTKTNKTVKKLTALSFIMLPLSLIVGIFGMNMSMIFITSNMHFILVIVCMAVIGIAMYWYFKVKEWF